MDSPSPCLLSRWNLNKILSLIDATPRARPARRPAGWRDPLIGDTLISVLRQLRAGYPQRPAALPPISGTALGAVPAFRARIATAS